MVLVSPVNCILFEESDSIVGNTFLMEKFHETIVALETYDAPMLARLREELVRSRFVFIISQGVT